MRAATELGLRTVAVYTHEDRFALHRFKADESYQIGPEHGGEPVKGYLNIDHPIATALEHDCEAVHPGYGFLSENADFSRACKENGITFVGPTPELLETFDANIAKARAAIAGASDEELFKPWTLLSNGNAIFTMPKIAVLRGFIMNHLIHHRAQLGVYLRLNDLPVPSIYGPSADESSF